MVIHPSKFTALRDLKILVAGDLILDHYLFGEANRISPEAPVPVLRVQREEQLPGGAGNVALNLASLGATPLLVGRIGEDEAGELLSLALEERGISVEHLVCQGDLPTSKKSRAIANGQQLMRIDREEVAPLDKGVESNLISQLPSLMRGVDAVAISDYAKGFLTTPLLRAVIDLAAEKAIPLIVDPKGIDFLRYRGATVIKPNRSEAIAAAGLFAPFTMDGVAEKLFEDGGCGSLLITCGSEGMLLFEGGKGAISIPTREKEVRDVTGAGDTVLAALCYALAGGLSLLEGAHLANIAAGLAVEHVGCAAIGRKELTKRLLQVSANGKFIDRGGLEALHSCNTGELHSLNISPNGQALFDIAIFERAKAIKALHPEGALLVQLDAPPPSSRYLEFIATLDEVDYIYCPQEYCGKGEG